MRNVHARSYHKTTPKPNLIILTWLASPEESDGIESLEKNDRVLFYNMLSLKNIIQHDLCLCHVEASLREIHFFQFHTFPQDVHLFVVYTVHTMENVFTGFNDL